MTTSDSNDDRELDDPALRSMRAVWLAMREEEPPAAGLSALLAAARIKAEAMQPIPWWRRALLSMRRPPVLAFATVLVLLGGAVLVSSQREKLDAMPNVSRTELNEGRAASTRSALDDGNAAPSPERAKDQVAPAADSPSKGYAGSAAVAADPAEVASADPSRPATAEVAPADPSRIAAAESGAPARRPAGPAPRPSVPSPPPGAESEGLASALPPPPAPPPPSSAQRETAGGVPPTADSDRGPEGDQRKNALDQAPAPAMAPKITRPSPPKQDLQIADDAGGSSLGEVQTTGAAQSIRSSGADEERVQSKSVRGPTLGQLAKQSETAASRGDCPAVRAIVGRIRKLDAEFHKKHVQAHAAVKRCVK